MDPLAEDYPGWSPYNYVLNNPVKLVDPDGRSVNDCTGCPDNAKIGEQVSHREFGELTYNGNYWEDSQGSNILDEVVITAEGGKSNDSFKSSIDRFDKGGGMYIDGIGSNNMGVLKGGNPLTRINYDEIPSYGGTVASSSSVNILQAIAKIFETINFWNDDGSSTKKVSNTARSVEKHNTESQKFYVKENVVFSVVPITGRNAPQFHRQETSILRTGYRSKAKADSSNNARSKDSLKVLAQYKKALQEYEKNK